MFLWHTFNHEGHGYTFNPNKGYVDGLVILANSMYGKIGKSAEEKIYYVKEVIIHPEYVCTGCAIKIGTHSFNLTCSHDTYPSNFKTTFICYYTELSFEVYNFLLGQLA